MRLFTLFSPFNSKHAAAAAKKYGSSGGAGYFYLYPPSCTTDVHRQPHTYQESSKQYTHTTTTAVDRPS
eukprot:scaffold2111_cov267-Chaetoceros_neogracile.AAC.9